MLGALDDEPLNNDSDQEEDNDCDDNTELIQQLEALSENFQEEYLMGAYQAKAEAVDKLKASFRGSKDVSKDDQKTQIKDLEKAMDKRRRDGAKKLKAKVSEVAGDDDLKLTQKLDQLKEGSETCQQIKNLMEQLWNGE